MTVLFEIQTVQATIFRNLCESLKSLFLELNIDVNENGIEATAIDSTHTVLSKLILFRDKFEKFELRERVKIGVDMLQFQNIIKTMSNNDILTLTMTDSANVLVIRIENPHSNISSLFKLNLIEINSTTIDIPNNINFDVVVAIPSNTFQKIIKEMNNVSTTVEIKSVNDQISFSCAGIFSERETTIKESNNCMRIVKRNTETRIVQCVYLLKIIAYFAKCTHLTPEIELHLKNDFALIVKYDVGTLGELRLVLSNYQEPNN
jgi:proliferating cell nuclear antigen